MGLARAMLRRSAVVILDEAMASICIETAIRIQQVRREEMRESTVITIGIGWRQSGMRIIVSCLGKGNS